MRAPRTWTGTSRLAKRVDGLTMWMRQHRSAFWLALFLLPAVVGYLVAALVLFPAPIFATSRTVPRLIGLPLSEAGSVLERTGLEMGETETIPHPTAPRGTVVWHDPPPEVAVPEGTAIALGVSGGPQRIPVPELTGYDAPLARQLVEAAGLALGRVDSSQAPVPKGVVVNSRPPAGTPLMPGDSVQLVVSIGAPTIHVPNLIGLTAPEARAVLEEARLTMGTSMPRTSMFGQPGTIIGQHPGANTLAAPGTPVNVTVARRRQ